MWMMIRTSSLFKRVPQGGRRGVSPLLEYLYRALLTKKLYVESEYVHGLQEKRRK